MLGVRTAGHPVTPAERAVVAAAVAWREANRDGFYGGGRGADDLCAAVDVLVKLRPATGEELHLEHAFRSIEGNCCNVYGCGLDETHPVHAPTEGAQPAATWHAYQPWSSSVTADAPCMYCGQGQTGTNHYARMGGP